MKPIHPHSHAVALVAMVLLVVAPDGSGQSVARPADTEPSGGGVWAPGVDGEPDEAVAVARLEALEEEGNGQWNSARRHWSEATRFAPRDEEALLGHARTLVAEGRPWDAALFLDAETRGTVDDPALLVAAGDAALASGSIEIALDPYARAVSLAPAEPAYRAAYAWALYLAEHDADVLVVLSDVRLVDLPVPVLLALSESAQQLERFDRSIEALLAALELEPDHAEIRLDLARAALLAGQDTQAYEALSAYLPEHGDDAVAWTLLGHVRLRVGQPDLALECYVAAVERGADAYSLAPLMDRARLSAEVFGHRTAVITSPGP